MYKEAVDALGERAAARVAATRTSILGHLVGSMLAGMYIGAAIVLILILGSTAPREFQRLVMGVSFGGALTMVIFAGSELFTGCNLVLTFGVLSRRTGVGALAANWALTWVGNLVGSAMLAVMVTQARILDAEPIRSFVLSVVDRKMHLAPEALFWRAVLANWMVCLGVWMSTRSKNDAARILLIGWSMFTFIACGYEHSVANMSGLLLGLLQPHGPSITFAGYAYNLAIVTAGNIVGGAVLVAGMYWLATPEAWAPKHVERSDASGPRLSSVPRRWRASGGRMRAAAVAQKSRETA